MNNKSKRKYLIVGPSWIGDMVMAQSLFITLKLKYPDCTIDVLAPKWSLPVLQRMSEIRRGISLDAKHGELSFFSRKKLGVSLRKEKYTHAIVVPRSWKSALVPYFANIAIRTGYIGEMRYGLINDIRKLDKLILNQTVQRYVAHALPDGLSVPPDIPFPSLAVDKNNQQNILEKLGLKLDEPVLCLMPGAEYGPAKQWPVNYYRKLAEAMLGVGWQVWVLGSDKDEVIGEEIAAEDNIYNLCGQTQLVDVIDLLACASSVVSNDSGLMHIAAAVGSQVNVIYGSSTPDYTPPLTTKDKKNIFYLDLECSPCFKRECPLGHSNCLNNIDYKDVFKKIINIH